MVGCAQRGDDGGTRGRYELSCDRRGREGDIARLAQIDDSGHRDGHEAVGTADGAVALRERLDNNILDAQVIEADGDRADVNDGVDSAHLVEHDGIGRFAVCLGLGNGERGKDGEGATFGAVAHLRAVDDRCDIVQRAVVMVVGVMMVLVVMAVGLVVMLVAVLMLAMVMMAVLVLVCVLDSCFVAVEPCHIVVVVLESLC